MEYIPKTNKFKERASFNVARYNFSLCTLIGHLIYMVGGQQSVEEQYFKRDYDSDSNEEEDEEVKSGEKRMRT